MSLQTIKINEFKILKDIEFNAGGHHLLLMGDNGVGKSSIIQFIEIALGKQSNVPPNAKGKGEIVITKDGKDITFKVDFKDGKPYIKVTGQGISIDNKKGAIADLVGALDFNVDEFAELSKTTAGRKEQVKIFKSFLPLDVRKELESFEANVKNAYDERTEINKDITKLKGSMALNPMFHLPDFELKKIKPVDTVDLMAQLKVITEANENYSKTEAGILERNNKINDKTVQVAELQNQINKLNEDIAALKSDVLKGNDWLKTHEKKDGSAIEAQIAEASKLNLNHSQATTLLADYAKLEEYTNLAGELTAKVDSSKEAIANAIREMESPIDGLTFDDETLVYNGTPVNPDCLSTSEIMELGIRLKMAENPELGILFIQRGESLGAERLKTIKDIADKAGWQLIMEQVERGEKKLHIEIMSDELVNA